MVTVAQKKKIEQATFGFDFFPARFPCATANYVDRGVSIPRPLVVL
jgi:hypothetical protein